jgi:YVTN family beta-propeller protein
MPTRQTVEPAGQQIEFGGRPVDMVLSPDERWVYLKDNRGLVVLDNAKWTLKQELPFGDEQGGSMHGIAVSVDGRRVYATTAQDRLYEAHVKKDGTLEWKRIVVLPGPGGSGPSHALGIALTEDGTTAYVCLSRNNTVGIVDLRSGALVAEIPVGVAPYAIVLSPDERNAYVSNWGGRPETEGDLTAPSSGTRVVVDARGIAASGSVSVIDLAGRHVSNSAPTQLHPTGMNLDWTGDRLYVAEANSDSVCALDAASLELIRRWRIQPTTAALHGSAPSDVAVDENTGRMFIAAGGNNAVAVVDLSRDPSKGGDVLGWLPTAWYPGAVVTDGAFVYVANTKGIGSRNLKSIEKGWFVHAFLGSVSKIPIPDDRTLAAYTRTVMEAGRVSAMKRAQRGGNGARTAVPVPRRAGDPSVFEHVVYIIKENRTYDQVFGDLPEGNGDPDLCVFGREVTPNHHALAQSFVLLDNYYCNGVVSADGHSWATEGNVTDHLEKSFGGFTRSYTFGDDPLTYSSSGFIWDSAIEHGRTFRNYGEMDYAEPAREGATFLDIYRDFTSGSRQFSFKQSIGIMNLRRYSCPEYPGWNMRIPDVLRAEVFIRELGEYELRGDWPNLIMVYLPQDHGSGTKPGFPTPRAHVADNDLALGRIVESISKSKFWSKTCVFVNEDDPQDGFDHVDGHRSICLVISPYTKRGKVISAFYNQTSVLHTIARILGMTPMNQMDALAPVMAGCFTDRPNFAPYHALPNRIPLDEMNPELETLSGADRHWAEVSLALNFDQVDAAEENALNRIIWHSAKGSDAPYPAHFAGAHGTGLSRHGLSIIPEFEAEAE